MSELNIGRTEYEQMVRGYPFIVRRNAQPIPTAAIDAQPAACALINLEWLAHIAGAIEALNQPDAWQGTDEEIYNAQQQLEQLAAAFSTICEMSQGATLQFRQTDCTLEMSDDGGATWTMIFNAGCAKTIITYNEITNNIEADGEPIVSGDTIINNTIIVDDTNDVQPDGLDKRCDVASYLTEIVFPTHTQDLITALEQSTNSNDFIIAILGLFAVGLAAPLTGGGSVAGYLGLTAFWSGATIAGAGAAAGALALQNWMESVNIESLEGELTPQFWQDLKCVIYCNLDSDGVLDAEQAGRLIYYIREELGTTYPLASETVVQQINAFTYETLGKYSIYGALYDGDNCDLCSCGPWFNTAIDTGDLWVSKYITPLGTTYIAPDGRLRDSAATLTNDEIEFIFDVTKTPAIITNIAPGGASYRDSDDGDSGSRYAYIDYWDVDTQQWVNLVTKTISTVAGNAFATGGYACPPCTKFKVKMTGWGIRGWSGSQSGINYLGITGAGVNVLAIEKSELGI